MRVSREKAEANRRNVVDVASRLFRQRGYDGIGLADLMKGAGLTQGGFYKQFGSKDDLIVEASIEALKGGAGRWADLASNASGHPLAAIVEFYLSAVHREEKAEGCAIAALGSDAARRGGPLRQAFGTGVEHHLDLLGDVIQADSDDDRRDKAMVTLSTMVGALILSRAVEDEELSSRILQASIRALLKQSPDERPANLHQDAPS